MKESQTRSLVDIALSTLDAGKAEDVVSIDLRGKTTIADDMIIATGRSARQVGAMADHLVEAFAKAGIRARLEGEAVGDWVLIDGGDLIVHLFRPEIRTFYNLERMWEADDEASAPELAERPRPQAVA